MNMGQSILQLEMHPASLKGLLFLIMYIIFFNIEPMIGIVSILIWVADVTAEDRGIVNPISLLQGGFCAIKPP